MKIKSVMGTQFKFKWLNKEKWVNDLKPGKVMGIFDDSMESRVIELENALKVVLEALETDDWQKKFMASKLIRETLK